MDKSKVAVIQCTSYDEDAMYEAVESGIKLLGGLDRFAGKDERILLKPNVLAGDHPDNCVSTHPSVLKAAGRFFQKVSGSLTYGDSPGIGRSAVHLEKAFLSRAADEIGLQMADFDQGREVHFGTSPFTEKFIIANGTLEADGLVSLSKLKTHMLTRITGAVKNQYGCIPGLIKKGYHLRMPNAFKFSSPTFLVRRM